MIKQTKQKKTTSLGVQAAPILKKNDHKPPVTKQ